METPHSKFAHVFGVPYGMKSSQARWLRRIRNGVCFLYLLLFVLFETYSAAATALDHTGRFPVWEAKLGWWLLILPCLLVAGLVFLLRGARENIELFLVGLSAFLYLAFLFLEDAVSRERMQQGEWLFTGIWIVLCFAATPAAWLLKRSRRSDLSE